MRGVKGKLGHSVVLEAAWATRVERRVGRVWCPEWDDGVPARPVRTPCRMPRLT